MSEVRRKAHQGEVPSLDAETVKDLEPAAAKDVQGGRSSSGKSIAGSVAGSHVT
ncbi:MAG: hypothetical protein ACKVVT_17845 [Dehalococcoidia bacterium]